jgi:hypothetical protein
MPGDMAKGGQDTGIADPARLELLFNHLFT